MAVHVVTGPPAAGKTTFVQTNAQPGDIRIDFDHLANALAGLDESNHSHSGPARAVAKAARTAAIDAALKHADTVDVWIIDSSPSPSRLARYRAAGATVHTIDPGKATVIARITRERPWQMKVAAERWYDEHAGGRGRAMVDQVRVTSFSYDTGRPPAADVVVDCRVLANPHQVAALRPRNGTHSSVRDWLMDQPGTVDLIEETMELVAGRGATSVAVGCSAGRHRSVVVAEEIASRLGTTARHLALEAKAAKAKARPTTTTARGLGWEHQKQRERLLAAHRDGTPCWWCGKPMYRSQSLDADHEEARANGGHRATRLLHSSCNRSRQSGARDSQRPALAAVAPPAGKAPVFDWGG